MAMNWLIKWIALILAALFIISIFFGGPHAFFPKLFKAVKSLTKVVKIGAEEMRVEKEIPKAVKDYFETLCYKLNKYSKTRHRDWPGCYIFLPDPPDEMGGAKIVFQNLLKRKQSKLGIPIEYSVLKISLFTKSNKLVDWCWVNLSRVGFVKPESFFKDVERWRNYRGQTYNISCFFGREVGEEFVLTDKKKFWTDSLEDHFDDIVVYRKTQIDGKPYADFCFFLTRDLGGKFGDNYTDIAINEWFRHWSFTGMTGYEEKYPFLKCEENEQLIWEFYNEKGDELLNSALFDINAENLSKRTQKNCSDAFTFFAPIIDFYSDMVDGETLYKVKFKLVGSELCCGNVEHAKSLAKRFRNDLSTLVGAELGNCSDEFVNTLIGIEEKRLNVSDLEDVFIFLDVFDVINFFWKEKKDLKVPGLLSELIERKGVFSETAKKCADYYCKTHGSWLKWENETLYNKICGGVV